MTDPEQTEPPAGPMADLARRHDNDRWLAALFMPAPARDGAMAVIAFNHEIARTAETVREPVMGQIRLQWWRDALDQLFGGQRMHHPLADALGAAVRRHGLARSQFDLLIDAREQDLDPAPPATLDCLVNYAEVTAAPIFRLMLELVGEHDPAALAAARHAGIAYGLAGILRAIPFHASQGRLLLPQDLLARHGLPAELPTPATPLAPALAELAALARDHMARARAPRDELGKPARAALLALVLADLNLAVLKRAGHDPFSPRVQMPHPMRQLRLGWQAALGRY